MTFRLMQVRRPIALLLLAATLIFGSQALAADTGDVSTTTGLTGSELEQVIHDYILAHPEVIIESVNRLRDQQKQEAQQRQQDAAANVKPVTEKDHVRGNVNAPVKIVEFSDFECPFCKEFQSTMQKLMDSYGKDGQVAWVYRHFPIDQLHPKARKEAQASECAAELGGNDAFWTYADKIFAVTPSNNGLDLSLLPKIAEELGLDANAFADCLSGDARGGKYADLIEADVEDAVSAGGTGTPFTIIVGPTGKTYPISGAMPLSAVTALVDVALNDK